MTVAVHAREADDPSPVLADDDGRWVVRGFRCVQCGYRLAAERPRCPMCRAALEEHAFGPGGTVWAGTILRASVLDRQPPLGLAYVDLDDGPRILCHFGEAIDLPGFLARGRGWSWPGSPTKVTPDLVGVALQDSHRRQGLTRLRHQPARVGVGARGDPHAGRGRGQHRGHRRRHDARVQAPGSPLRLTDIVELDVRLGIAEHLAARLGSRFEPPALLRQMVNDGKLGQKM